MAQAVASLPLIQAFRVQLPPPTPQISLCKSDAASILSPRAKRSPAGVRPLSDSSRALQLRALGPARWGAAPKRRRDREFAGGAIWRRCRHLEPWNGKGKARQRRPPTRALIVRGPQPNVARLPPGRTEGDVSRSS